MKLFKAALTSFCIAITTLYFSACPAIAQGSGLFIVPDATTITNPITGQTWRFNSTSQTIQVYNGSSYTTMNYPFSNLSATTNPTASNDNTQGYVIGSFWLNQTTQTLFVASSVVTSSAVWIGVNQVTASIPLNTLQQGGATDGQSLVWNNSGAVWQPGDPAIDLDQLTQSGATSGQVPSWSGSAWVASNAAAGTVTSFSTGNLSPLFTASVSSATTTPVLSFALSNAAAHSILSNTSSSSGAPSYNALSLTAGTGITLSSTHVTDSPTISLTTPVSISNLPSGVNNAISNSAGVLSVTGVSNTLTVAYSGSALPLANGGTAATTAAGAATNILPSATSGQVPEWNGSNWVAATVSGTGTVTSFSAGNLSPFFTTSVANSTTTPALTFTASNAAANTILANIGATPAVPSYVSLALNAGSGLQITNSGDLTTGPTMSLITPISNSTLGSTVVTSVGNLSPIFTTTLSSQTLGFVLSTATGHTFLGNNTGSTTAPAYVAIGAGDLPSTTVNSTGNLSPFFTSSISGQALSFTASNAAGNSILSNTSGSPAVPAYNVLSLSVGSGLSITSSGNLANSPTLSLSTVPVANGGTGTALFTSGQATFVSAGSIAVVDASITSSSIIVVTQVGTTPLSEYYSVAITPTTGFTIYSSNATSTATVNYIRIK